MRRSKGKSKTSPLDHSDARLSRPREQGLSVGVTALTVGAAQVDFGRPWNDLVALGIALVKASLVVLFFMHVKGSTPLVKITAAGGFFWLLILFALLLADFLTRPSIGGRGL